MKVFFLTLVVIAVSCSMDKHVFTPSDQDTINEIRRNYTNGWLANDSQTILDLFAEDATIIPGKLSPITGKENIKEYWFPEDGSETTIHTYSVELLELNGTDSMAYSLEKGILNFTYTLNDFSTTKESISHASTVYRKNRQGEWKIISRMWTNLNE